MGIKKSDIAGLAGAATGAIKAVKSKMKDDKAKKQPTAQATAAKSVAQNSASSSYGQNSADQAKYEDNYGGDPFAD